MDGGAWWAAVMGSRRVGHDWATSLSLFTFMHWRRKWQHIPVFLPGESQGRGSLVGCLSVWVTQSRTRLKPVSSSRSPWFSKLRHSSPLGLPVREFPCSWELVSWLAPSFGAQVPAQKLSVFSLLCLPSLSYLISRILACPPEGLGSSAVA